MSRRHHGRGKRSVHFHNHHHRTVILPSPVQPPPRSLTPTMQSFVHNPTRIYAPTWNRNQAHSPSLTAMQTSFRPTLPAPAPVPVQREDDDFGTFLCAVVGIAGLAFAVMGGGGGGGGGGGPRR